jgi:drug/metabolite transporter (DMT)-like permease
LRGLPLRFSRREHLFMALQGLLLFCLNYVGFYISEQYLASGLVAVICSMLTVGNIIGMRVFFGVHTQLAQPAGRDCSASSAWSYCSGPNCAPWRPVAATHDRHGLGVRRHHQRLARQHGSPPATSAGSCRCCRSTAGRCSTARSSPASSRSQLRASASPFDWSWRYVGALVYLAVFGSVLAFGAYLTLMKRIGAGRAGYSMVAIPVVALLISTFLEHLQWTAPLYIGVALCLAGNVLVLRRDRQ